MTESKARLEGGGEVLVESFNLCTGETVSSVRITARGGKCIWIDCGEDTVGETLAYNIFMAISYCGKGVRA